MKPFCTALFFSLLLLAASAGDSDAFRTWTSLAGSEFSGRLSEVKDDAIVLDGRDGRKLTVKLDQLSEADRAYIRDLQRQRHTMILEFYREGIFEDPDLPERARIEGVRHVVQRENFCVPASAEMVLRFYGYSFDQDYLARISSRDSSRSAGTNLGALAQGLRNLGIDSVGIPLRSPRPEIPPFENAINGIRTAIAEGFPTVIAYDMGSMGHAVVAVGYDDRRRAFSVLDPAQQGGPQRLDYKVLERVFLGSQIILPGPGNGPATAAETDAGFLQQVSAAVRNSRPDTLQELVEKLQEENIPAQFRDANRYDLRSSQGQTRSYARRDGVEFIRMALERGAVVVAPQTFDQGVGLILIYGVNGNDFRAVEYFPDGTFRRGEVRALDFSLRWIWREENRYFLPLVEVHT